MVRPHFIPKKGESKVAVHVDMTGVSTTFEPLPQGYYQAVVEKCEQTVSKEKQTPMLRWVFNVIEPEEFAGRKAFTNTMLVKSSMWVLKRLLIAIGLGTEESLSVKDEEGNTIIEFDEEDTLGLECTVVIVPHEYEGRSTTQVGEVLEAGAYEEVEE